MGNETYRRRPGLAWRDEEEARSEVLKALEEGEEVENEGTLIIVDGGQIFELNLLGAEIWKLCDGERSVDDIVEVLSGQYDVERTELESDVVEFLAGMAEKTWVERL